MRRRSHWRRYLELIFLKQLPALARRVLPRHVSLPTKAVTEQLSLSGHANVRIGARLFGWLRPAAHYSQANLIYYDMITSRPPAGAGPGGNKMAPETAIGSPEGLVER